MSQTFNISVPKLKQQQLVDAASNVAMAEAIPYFTQHRWWWINGNEMIFDAETGNLWQGKPNLTEQTLNNGKRFAVDLRLGGINSWMLPTQGQVKVIVENGFPLRSGSYKKILESSLILINDGAMWLDQDYPTKVARDAMVVTTLALFTAKPTAHRTLEEFAKRNWTIKPHDQDNQALKNFLGQYNLIKAAEHKQYTQFNATQLQALWQNIDHISARLPKLDNLRFSEINQGLWEFFDDKKSQRLSVTVDSPLYGRNPVLDIQEGNVAIDFGTSSTVVALKRNGRDELLRIGLKDFNEAPKPEHYENPTVLEMVDFQNFLIDWTSEAYRPLVCWDDVRCSHEARATLRNNDSNPQKIGSILLRLKQWALRDNENYKVKFTDQYNCVHELASLAERNPVKGQALTVDKNYPFDPIELYAWFLGLTINWRQRGIFLHYYMTFPVAYPTEVKNKILASFRRGLQRSLPASLVNDAKFAEFSVEERASEPAAFAAAALEALEIAPVDGGVAYAVFDFGGGTTDFDYGFYRLPTNAEVNEGWEHVLEHFGSSGDRYLGGENLLENLAYLVFCANVDVCRKHDIAFTQPLDALSFAGSELLITNTQAAYTNTNMMMSKLRPLWEKGVKNQDASGTTKVKLVNRQGVLVECDFKIKEQELIVWLEARIQKGLHNFFIGLKQAFTGHGQKNNDEAVSASIKDKFSQRHQKNQSNHTTNLPKEIHILLAGNSSRSPIVLGLLGRLEDDVSKKLYERTKKGLADIFGDSLPDLEIHLPLNTDDKNPYKPTAKTGVALGLLRLCPGESLYVINHAKSQSDDSPFHFYVGSIKLNKFSPALQRGSAYNQWIELGPIRDRIAYLVYTTTPRASLGTMPRGDSELIEKKLSFAGDTTGHKVFARAISPHEVEICTAASLAETSAKVLNNVQKHKLG